MNRTTHVLLDRLLAISSVQHAIKAEKLLQSAGIKVEMIPTPRQLSRSCGQCLLFASGRQKECLQLLTEGNIHWMALYRRDRIAINGWDYEKLAERMEETS
ncbi:MAG TPA: DUF3343 domain-containing protein [Patescibacteria group bacterium]|nr:DUF3343 domain-containing protein [Patescibacteria group bacterium]